MKVEPLQPDATPRWLGRGFLALVAVALLLALALPILSRWSTDVCRFTGGQPTRLRGEPVCLHTDGSP